MKVVMPYHNPDLDGVACAIAVSIFYPGWKAVVSGILDNETACALSVLGFEIPDPIQSLKEVRSIWLVDTHHKAQLPENFPFDKVVCITDHHPGGDLDLFENATVTNHEVGAAATIIAEGVMDRLDEPENRIIELLQLAILSNTLGLKAPSTHERDYKILEKLASLHGVSKEIILRMTKERNKVLKLNSQQLISSDTKLFKHKGQNITVGQVEAEGAIAVLERNDLHAEMESFIASTRDSMFILNLVDVAQGCSAIITSNDELTQYIGHCLNVVPDTKGVIRIQRLTQRKTDIVPFLN